VVAINYRVGALGFMSTGDKKTSWQLWTLGSEVGHRMGEG